MVFKAYLKLIPSHLGSVIMYMAIFFFMVNMVVAGTDGISSGSGSIDGFTSLVAVNDLDKSEESEALTEYLKKSDNIKLAEIDFERENAVQDSIYNRKAEYVLIINKGFAENLKSGNYENILSSEVIPGSSSEMFVGNEIDSYMAAVKLYLTGGYDSVSACREAAKTLEKGVEVTDYKQEQGWNDENKEAYLFYNFVPYVMIMMVLSILVPTLSTFFNDEMRSRSLCSPITPAAYTAQVIGGAFVVSLGIFAFLILTGIAVAKGRLFNEMSGWSLLQMFVFTMFVLVLSGLIGVLCSGRKKAANYVTSIVSNILGLGMSFMCGVFVKQSLLGEGILNAGKLLPVYWYVRGNNMIMGGDGQVFDKKEVIICILIQLLFVAAVFSAALLAAVVKKGKRSDK
ncbi:MAG TPA: hypothetical protein DDX91_07030 [Ruminococcaceae bacterium]|nr:hypothetical protein [Oscillospiraceae bacterium]